MAKGRLPKASPYCAKCGGEIPSTRRSDAKYCSTRCSDAAEKKRYCDRTPEYVARQRMQVRKLHHLKEHGHTEFLNNPDLNPKDKFAVARSYGMRSMLEVNVARQLEAAGGKMSTRASWFGKKNHVLKVKAKLRSGLEDRVVEQLNAASFEYSYENLKLPYTTEHVYIPDLLLANGIIVECKGLFTSEDRSKHLSVKKAHPGLDIRFVFSRSASPLYKGSKSTYASWCEKHGYPHADKLIPEAWLKEPKK